MNKGRLFPDYYITCGKCGYGQHVGESIARIAKQAAGELGWRHSKDSGWLCPECVKTVVQSRIDAEPREG